MGGRSGLMLLMAVVCGLGAMYGANRMLSKGAKAPEMRDIVVAARDLPIEEVLKPDALKVVKVPVAGAPVGAFAKIEEVEDRWVQIKMLADEPIMAAKLAPKNAPPGLVSRIPPGMRAMAIEVNEQTGVSGFILPGHRVDLVQARTDGASRPGDRPAAETILEDVLVLAAGQVISRPEDKSMVVRTVTVALAPDDVDRVAAAKPRGPLLLVLRGLNDHQSRPRRAAPAPPPPAPKPVVVPVRAPAPAPAPAPPPPPPTRFLAIYRGLAAPERIPMAAGHQPAGAVVVGRTAARPR